MSYLPDKTKAATAKESEGAVAGTRLESPRQAPKYAVR
jgi:hypothetical protein